MRALVKFGYRGFLFDSVDKATKALSLLSGAIEVKDMYDNAKLTVVDDGRECSPAKGKKIKALPGSSFQLEDPRHES